MSNDHLLQQYVWLALNSEIIIINIVEIARNSHNSHKMSHWDGLLLVIFKYVDTLVCFFINILHFTEDFLQYNAHCTFKPAEHANDHIVNSEFTEFFDCVTLAYVLWRADVC